jgi:hypothetical protein
MGADAQPLSFAAEDWKFTDIQGAESTIDLYVSERVKDLTKGQQTPTTVKPPNVPDFSVALLR